MDIVAYAPLLLNTYIIQKTMIEFTDSHLYKLLSKDWVESGYAGTDEYGFNVLSPQRCQYSCRIPYVRQQ